MVQFETDYYYSAYPYATANDLKAAEIVETALDDLGKTAAGMTPDQFASAYTEFLKKAQANLGETGEAPVGC